MASCPWGTYAFWQALPDIGKLTTDHGATLMDCLQTHHNKTLGCPPLNYQTSYFCGHEPACRDPPDEGPLLQAVRHVVENYALVGTLEQLDDFKEQMVAMFPDWIHPEKRHLWRTKGTQAVNVNKHQPTDRSESEWTRLRQANHYDVLLYEIVQELSNQRLTQCRQQRQQQQRPKHPPNRRPAAERHKMFLSPSREFGSMIVSHREQATKRTAFQRG